MFSKIYIILFLFFIFLYNSANADPNNDQWEDTEKTYVELIDEGYEVKSYDMTNFTDITGNMYMFFVTVLQKSTSVYECREYQIFDELMNTLDLSFVCRKLVKPYKKGLKT